MAALVALTAAIVVAGALAGPSADAALPHLPISRAMHAATVAGPGTTVSYPAGATSSSFSGLAFDACAAPSTATMQAWTASPYRGVGVYVGGANRLCSQPNLTQTWVGAVTAMGWKLLPIVVGRQAPCTVSSKPVKITPSRAAAQGTADADSAITALAGLGMGPGSPVYFDMENYSTSSASCRTAVLRYLSGVTAELHAHGYLSGVYVNLSSGAVQLTAAYTTSIYARPDVIWVARWDDKPDVSGLSGLPASRWSSNQRIKQYLGNHTETYAGVKINIDRDAVQAPVAVIATSYPLVGENPTAYSAPSIGATAVHTLGSGQPVPVLCQTPGQSVVSLDPVTGDPVSTTSVWDLLADGTYVNDTDVQTPTKPGFSENISRCSNPFQVTATSGLTLRAGPGAATAGHGSLPLGALAWITCQTSGEKVDRSKVWDQLDDGSYVSDRYVATTGTIKYSPPIPRCPAPTP